MRSLGIYHDEFKDSVRLYAELKYVYEIQMAQFRDSGYQVEIPYTNKNGNENLRKTVLYQSLEKTRTDLSNLQTILGLNPQGLKKILNNPGNGNGNKQPTPLEKVLMGID